MVAGLIPNPSRACARGNQFISHFDSFSLSLSLPRSSTLSKNQWIKYPPVRSHNNNKRERTQACQVPDCLPSVLCSCPWLLCRAIFSWRPGVGGLVPGLCLSGCCKCLLRDESVHWLLCSLIHRWCFLCARPCARPLGLATSETEPPPLWNSHSRGQGVRRQMVTWELKHV